MMSRKVGQDRCKQMIRGKNGGKTTICSKPVSSDVDKWWSSSGRDRGHGQNFRIKGNDQTVYNT